MIPRHEVVALQEGWSAEECRRVVQEHKHTRYPLCSNSLDDAIGVIHVKDLLCLDAGEALDLKSCARPLERIPDLLPIREVLRTMQGTQSHLALVVNELGSVVGAITLENVIEQLVGAVQDEFDSETPPLVATEPGTWMAAGELPLTRLNQEPELRLGHPGVSTLSGFLTVQLGRLPRVGDRVQLEEMEVEVLEIQNYRATQIRPTALVDGRGGVGIEAKRQ
jgi:CBS domain containing-hemolysin-like protein